MWFCKLICNINIHVCRNMLPSNVLLCSMGSSFFLVSLVLHSTKVLSGHVIKKLPPDWSVYGAIKAATWLVNLWGYYKSSHLIGKSVRLWKQPPHWSVCVVIKQPCDWSVCAVIIYWYMIRQSYMIHANHSSSLTRKMQPYSHMQIITYS